MDEVSNKVTELEFKLKKLGDQKKEHLSKQEYTMAAQIRDEETKIRAEIKRLKKTN